MVEWSRLLRIWAVVAMLLALSGTAMAAEGCLSGSCHRALTEVKYLHGPVAAEMAGAQGCKMCHLPAGVACTPAKGGQFTLKGKDICLTCHDKGTGTLHSQSEVEDKCLTCHVPHGSNSSPNMLREPQQ